MHEVRRAVERVDVPGGRAGSSGAFASGFLPDDGERGRACELFAKQVFALPIEARDEVHARALVVGRRALAPAFLHESGGLARGIERGIEERGEVQVGVGHGDLAGKGESSPRRNAARSRS